MKSDSWFYGIFRECRWLLFRLLRLPEDQSADYRFDAVELKETSFRLDGIFCPERPGDTYYFLEVQLYKDADFYRKWMAKILLYALQYRIKGDWRGLVLFRNRSQEPTRSHGIEEWIASGRIQPMYLEELPDYPEVSLEVAVLKLAVTERDDVFDKVRDLVAATQSPEANVKEPKKLLETIEVFLVLNFPDLTRAEIQTMLLLDEIRQSRIFKEGVQEGIQEGEAKGKLEEKMALIVRLHAKGQTVEEICALMDVDGDFVRKTLAQQGNDS